jgi:hypothetical protein
VTNTGIAGKECRDKERLLQVAQATFATTMKLSARNDKKNTKERFILGQDNFL